MARVLCGECEFWVPCGCLTKGVCHAKPPIAVPTMSMASNPEVPDHCSDEWGMFPLVQATDWCGEGKHTA